MSPPIPVLKALSLRELFNICNGSSPVFMTANKYVLLLINLVGFLYFPLKKISISISTNKKILLKAFHFLSS